MPSVSGPVGTITAPGSTGQQTYTLPGGSGTVKALLLFWTLNTGDGSIAHMQFGWGMGTYRGGSVQQVYGATASQDTPTASAGGISYGTDAICVILVNTGASRDAEIDLVSLGDAQFVLDWVDLPASADSLLSYVALCGDDFTDAMVSTFKTTTGTGAQDISVTAGFGQPDLVLTLWPGTDLNATINDAYTAATTMIGTGMGAAIKDGARRASAFCEDSGAGTMETASWQKQGIALWMDDGVPGTEQGEVDMNASSGWPTDGFEINRVTSTAQTVGYLALKGTFNKALSARTTPTSTGDSDYDVSFSNQKVAICWGSNVIPAAGSTSPDATAAEGHQFWAGACDHLANEFFKGFSEENTATAADTYSYHSGAKTVQMHNADDASLLLEADGSFTGTNFRLGFNDIDATSREFNALVLGWDVPATAVPKVSPVVVDFAVDRAANY